MNVECKMLFLTVVVLGKESMLTLSLVSKTIEVYSQSTTGNGERPLLLT